MSILLVAVIGFFVGLFALMTLSVSRARRNGISMMRAIGQAILGGFKLMFAFLP